MHCFVTGRGYRRKSQMPWEALPPLVCPRSAFLPPSLSPLHAPECWSGLDNTVLFPPVQWNVHASQFIYQWQPVSQRPIFHCQERGERPLLTGPPWPGVPELGGSRVTVGVFIVSICSWTPTLFPSAPLHQCSPHRGQELMYVSCVDVVCLCMCTCRQTYICVLTSIKG